MILGGNFETIFRLFYWHGTEVLEAAFQLYLNIGISLDFFLYEAQVSLHSPNAHSQDILFKIECRNVTHPDKDFQSW